MHLIIRYHPSFQNLDLFLGEVIVVTRSNRKSVLSFLFHLYSRSMIVELVAVVLRPVSSTSEVTDFYKLSEYIMAGGTAIDVYMWKSRAQAHDSLTNAANPVSFSVQYGAK